MAGRSCFRLDLKCEVQLEDRISESSEFHRDREEGIHDLREISERKGLQSHYCCVMNNLLYF